MVAGVMLMEYDPRIGGYDLLAEYAGGGKQSAPNAKASPQRLGSFGRVRLIPFAESKAKTLTCHQSIQPRSMGKELCPP